MKLKSHSLYINQHENVKRSVFRLLNKRFFWGPIEKTVGNYGFNWTSTETPLKLLWLQTKGSEKVPVNSK